MSDNRHLRVGVIGVGSMGGFHARELDVRRVVSDLIERGYDGGFSMEPHMKIVVHEADRGSEPAARCANYVEYGRRFERLLAGLGRPVRAGGEA